MGTLDTPRYERIQFRYLMIVRRKFKRKGNYLMITLLNDETRLRFGYRNMICKKKNRFWRETKNN